MTASRDEKAITEADVRDEHRGSANPTAHWADLIGVLVGGLLFMVALIAVLGATIGMGLGLFFAWAVVGALDDDVLVLSIPWGQVAVALVAAGLSGVVAAGVPAWREAPR